LLWNAQKSFCRVLFVRNAGEFSVVETCRRNEVPDEIPEIECRGIIGGGTVSGIRFRNARDGTRIRRAVWHPFTGIASAIRRVGNSIFCYWKLHLLRKRLETILHRCIAKFICSLFHLFVTLSVKIRILLQCNYINKSHWQYKLYICIIINYNLSSIFY